MVTKLRTKTYAVKLTEADIVVIFELLHFIDQTYNGKGKALQIVEQKLYRAIGV